MDVYRYQIFSDIDEFTMSDFSRWLATIPADASVVIEITSHGGLVFYGNAVYQKIQEAQRDGITFTAKIYGVAASSAADIVLSCNRIEMASTAAIMIHSAWNSAGGNDEGIRVANDAQLAVIKKRLPEYTETDLKKDRWFKADEALKIGLIDAIFDVDNNSVEARLCAKYLAEFPFKGDLKMEEEIKKEDQKSEIIEEDVKDEEIKEEEVKEEPSRDDVIERLVEEVRDLAERIRKIEEASAECGDRRDNARMKAIFEKIEAISKPCESTESVIHSVVEDPKASLEKHKNMYPNLDRLVDVD